MRWKPFNPSDHEMHSENKPVMQYQVLTPTSAPPGSYQTYSNNTNKNTNDLQTPVVSRYMGPQPNSSATTTEAAGNTNLSAEDAAATETVLTKGAANDEAKEDEAEDAAPPPTIPGMLKILFTSSKINFLYVCTPVGLVSGYAGWHHSITFIFCFLALIPLAAVLGDLTEDVALRTNDAIGALINVTFGNATELIISLAALRLEQYFIIKMSLVGSVLGNMLLVLGSSFLVGGAKNPTLKFSSPGAQTYMSTLILASFSFIVPTSFFTLNKDAGDPHYALEVSQSIGLLLMVIYAAFIFFQLRTHKSLFEANDEEEEEEETPQFTLWFAVGAIATVAVLISFLSDFLVESISGTADSLRVGEHFIGLVLVPIVGNVAEHASAVMMASKGKMDIALGIALGSAIQISMFAWPLTVVISWIWGKKLDLVLSPFLAGCLFATVMLTFSVVSSGSSTWLSGGKLVGAYLILCSAFLFAPDDH